MWHVLTLPWREQCDTQFERAKGLSEEDILKDLQARFEEGNDCFFRLYCVANSME